MRTRMATKLDAIEARVVALESSLKNQETTLRSHENLFRSQDSTLKGHTAMLTEHSTQLSSLVTGVADLTRSFATFRSEVREGLQLLQRHDRGKERIEFEKELTPSSSMVLSGDGGKQSNGHSGRTADQLLEDFRLAAKKVELPYFRGEDPFGWVSRAEACFSIQRTPEDIQIELAQICMEGPSWHWFKMLREEEPSLDWEKFKRAFFDRYGDQFSGNLFMQLKML